MRAILRTGCECERGVETTFPPPPEIQIPMIAGPKDTKWTPGEISPVGGRIRMRRFALDHGLTGYYPGGAAIYNEVVE